LLAKPEIAKNGVVEYNCCMVRTRIRRVTIILMAALLLCGAVVFFRLNHSEPPSVPPLGTPTAPASTASGAIPYVPTPPGWIRTKLGESQKQGILAAFNKISLPPANGEVGYDLEVDIDHQTGSLGEQLSASTLYGAFASTQIWSVIGGHLVLEFMLPEQVDYLVVGNGTDTNYFFTLSSFNDDVAGLGNGPFNSSDLQMFQTMVRNFATALPSE
jgi:hypothetical protein